MHNENKTLKNGYKYTRQLFTIHTPSGEHPQFEGDQIRSQTA